MDAFTMEMCLCDGEGVADLELLAWMRALGGHPIYVGPAFACTGSAHLAGEHVRCTNDVHRVRMPTQKGGTSPYFGDALHVDRLAFEVKELIRGEDPDDPNVASILVSLEACHRVSNRIIGERWYYPHELIAQTGTPVTLTASVSL